MANASAINIIFIKWQGNYHHQYHLPYPTLLRIQDRQLHQKKSTRVTRLDFYMVMDYKQTILSTVAVSLIAFAVALQVIIFSPISPQPLELPPASSYSSHGLPTNTRLQQVIKLGEGILKQPEDVCMDKRGVLYTATRDGWIKRMHRNGSWENWKMIHGSRRDTLLGLTVTRAGHLIVCDTQQGLIKVDEDGGVTILASHVNGASIRFADDVVEAPDGTLYFSVASTKFGLHDWFFDVLEAKPHGQLLKYDPSTKETSVVLDGLGFANGVAISSDEEYLVVCETWKFRCLKYWLKEGMEGKVETFIENLPGAPDNIKVAPDGSFWIALLQLIPSRLEFVHSSTAIKHLLATFPKLLEHVKGFHGNAMVVKVCSNGKIIKKFDDPNGQVMSTVTSVLEFEGNLYLGSLNTDFVGKLPLETA